MNYGPIKTFITNKIDSPLAELIMYYGDQSRWHGLWLAPLFVLFHVLYYISAPVMIIERKIVNRKSKRSKQHEPDKERTL